MTTAEQVNDALSTWLETQASATAASVAWNDLRQQVGTNDTTRKEAARSMPADEYAQLTALCADAEHNKLITAAESERAEKILNVQRELLQRETAEVTREAVLINTETVKLQYAAAKLTADTVALNRGTGTTRTPLHLAPIPGIDDEPQPQRRHRPLIDVGMDTVELF